MECAYRFVAGLEYAFEDGLLTDEPDVRLHCADYFTGITVYECKKCGDDVFETQNYCLQVAMSIQK